MNSLIFAPTLALLAGFGELFAQAPPGPDSDSTRPVEIFILSGQSNMEGVGNSAKLPVEFAKQPEVKIWSAILAGPDPKAWEPLGGGFGVGKGFGPEVTLGHALKTALPDKDVYLIKSARSGTPLSKSAPINFDPKATKSEYAALIRRVKAALSDLEASGRTVSVKAMFWMQGESDASDRLNSPDSPEPSAERYEANLRNFLGSVKKDLELPELPVFVGRLPRGLKSTVFRGQTYSKAPLVIAGQEKVAGDPSMNTVLVPTDDIALGADRLHYNSEGQMALGLRFAQAYLKRKALAVINPRDK